MRKPGLDGACWPDEREEAILRVVVGPDETVADAWRALRPVLVFDDLWDAESHRLLPLVYRRVHDAGIADEKLPRLKGLYRRTWYDNQRLFHGAAPVLRQLHAAGIDTLLLKGVPLALAHYRDLGVRPMADIDVLVPYEAFDATLDLLSRDGWRDLGLDIDRERRRRSYHGAAMSHPDGRAFDVHWQLAMPFVFPRAEHASSEDFWAAAVPLEVRDVAVRALSPPDLLLHVIVHGAWSGSASNVRWAADAVAVLRSSAVDWARLVEQTVRRRLVLPVRNGLRYLQDVLSVPLPADVVDAVWALPVTAHEVRAYEIAAGETVGPEVIGGLLGTRAYWARQSEKWGPLRRARELPYFLQDNWNLAHRREVPVEALRKTVRRVRMSPGSRSSEVRGERGQ